ncbi:MAG: hypothetical protein QXK89_00320 [Candidatus Bathyarchaeia archaeon]
MSSRLIPDLVMKAILSGLLDSSWGSFHRSTIVRLTVYGNYMKIGIGEGSVHQWELDALRDTPIKNEWISIEMPRIVYVGGIKYIPEKKASGMPRGLLPVRSNGVYLFVSDKMRMIFPAYRCFDINFGEQRILSILSPRTLVRDFAEAVHPAFPDEKYHGRVHSAEVKVEELNKFFEMNYGVGMLRKRGSVKSEVEAFPLLGREDIKAITEKIRENGN